MSRVRFLHSSVPSTAYRIPWAKEHLEDHYVKLAHKDGYRCRSAYKLIELQSKFRILKPNISVVDLGASPGSWSQVAADIVFKSADQNEGVLIAVDILCFCTVDIFSLHPFFILIASAIVGVSGNHAVINLGVAAMSMDLSSEKYRTLRMGVFEGCLLLGSIVSSFLSGVIIDSMGFLGTFAFVVLIWSLTICYVKCIPESLNISKVNRRDKFNMKHVFVQAVTPLRLFKFNKNRVRFIFFLIAYIFVIEDLSSLRSVFSLYVLAPPICWGPQYQGYFFGLLYSTRLIGVYLILPLLLLCHVPDTVLLFIGALDCAVVFGLAGVYYSMWWLLGVVPVSGLLASLGVPSIRSGLSKLVQPTEQASMLTILELVNTVSTLASTLFFNAIYPTLRQSNAAYSFYMISFTSIVPCSAVVLLMGYEYWKRHKKSAKDVEERSLLRSHVAIN